MFDLKKMDLGVSATGAQTRLRVLFVPDSVHWVTGTIAKSIARCNPWIEATIASGPVINTIFTKYPELMQNFDLVHFTCPYASKEWLPRFRDQIPCVTSHHHVTDWEPIKHNVDGDAIVVGSSEWVEDLRARGVDMKKVFCVPYGVDSDLFTPPGASDRASARQRLGLDSSATVIGFFGKNSSNDDGRKGIDVFTKAIADLAKQIANLAVLIVGPGWKELAAVLTASGVKCAWVPFVAAQTELATMYHALDFYWVTARVEGGPVTLLEAMSSAVCCLSTRVGLAREIIKDGENGMLMPFDDAEAFVRETTILASNVEERSRLGHNARATILAEMDVSVVATRVRDVYIKAEENMRSRQPRLRSLEIKLIAASTLAKETPLALEIPLSGFPVALHRHIQMLESLAWSEHLILYHRQRMLALKLIGNAWLRNPFSTLPTRVFLRRFLPVSLVARLVRFKNRSSEPVTSFAR